MKKMLISLFAPSPKKIATMAADKIQNIVNKSDKQNQIAKFAEISQKATEIQIKLNKWFEDGKLDDIETKEIAAEIEPMIERIYNLI